MKGKTVLSTLLTAIIVLTIATSMVAATGDGGCSINSTQEVQFTNDPLKSRIDDILAEGKSVFLFFHADWCPYCHQETPIIDQLEAECAEEVAFIRINVTARPDHAAEFNVSALPTMIVISGTYEDEYLKEEISGFAKKAELSAIIASDEGDKLGDTGDDGSEIAPLETSTTCNSCEDCTEKLKSGEYDVVTLTTDITDHEGSCIGLIMGESNVVFDCNGHTIDGDDFAIDPESGVAMMHGTGNTIKNCVISDFSEGIQLWDVTNHEITGNTMISNDYGIRMGWSDSNIIDGNIVNENHNGIALSNSNSNTINSNTVCKNINSDFLIESGTGNSGDENVCDRPDSWNDAGTTGCTDACSGTITCNSCSDCSDKLSGTYDTVMLTTDITNHAGTCIIFGASDVVFDGDGHRIDGDDSGTDYGIYVSGKSGNTIKNCVVTDFHNGIYLTDSTGNTIDKNTANSNTEDGFHLSGSSGNTIAHFNEANSNGRFGIFLSSSSDNQVSFNDVNSNDEVGIRLSNSGSNIITFNDVLDNNNQYAWGIYLYRSDSNIVASNEVTNNYYGIKLDNSHSNTFNSNKVCSNPGLDFDVVGGSSGNSGDLNRCCASPDEWNDIGETGCTFPCDTLPDINNDGISDACDCFDAHQGINEMGIDCGGICPACRALPSGWSNVAGVRLRGAPNSGFIDVVFVPEQSYSGDLVGFQTAVNNNIRNWYLRLDDMTVDPLPGDYRDKFNFYRYTGGFGTQAGCAGTLPGNFWSDAPGADVGVILAAPGSGAWGCANGLGPPGGHIHFIALAEREGQVIHESGHAIFGLIDQYCGDTHYEQNTPTTNVWSSFANCQNDATAQGWTGGNCRQITGTSCSKNYWKYDPTGLMDGSSFLCTPASACTLVPNAVGEACAWRINWVFNNWPAGHSKGILVHFNIKDSIITELGSEVVGGHPDVGLQTEHFRVELLSAADELLQKYGIWDPRIEIGDEGEVVYTDDVDFSLTFPVHENIRTANIYDPETEELKASVDFSSYECTCNSCSDCEAKLKDPACIVVKLTADIINHSGSCISLIKGESDVVFDGDGHTIDGDDFAIDPDHGIAMMHGIHNTIKNCVISDFSNGIYLLDATDHVITKNTITSNDEGIEMGWSDGNIIDGNMVNENYNGIVLSNSNSNTINLNIVCKNTNLDFLIESGTGNSGDENACDRPDGWNDAGTQGCTYDCTLKKPDLMITDILNDDGTICYEIKNIGDATAQKGHYTILHVDGVYQIKEEVTVDLAPGASTKRCFDHYSWSCTSPDDTMEVCADYGDFVDESNEKNNCLDVTLTCESPATPGDAIIYHADYGAGIWQMNPDGSGNTQLSDHGWFAEYSFDNTKIAFGEYYNNGIWVMDADGTDQIQLTSTGGTPTWSPDSTKIAYFVGGTTGTERRIWIMDVDGSNAHKLSDNPGDFPAWSPDGTKIAYNDEVGSGIWLINPDGTGETQLCTGGGLPAWSPDGRKMAYRSLTDGCIWTMNADGSDKTKVSTNKGTHPAWSSDGTKIAYEDNTGIWVINADGTDEHMINQGGHAPDWMSPGIAEELPDLIVALDGPEKVIAGEDVALEVIVSNIGSATAPGSIESEITYYVIDLILSYDDYIPLELAVNPVYAGKTREDFVEDMLLGDGRISRTESLSPGSSVSYTLDLHIPEKTSPGIYCLGAVVDPAEAVEESSEENNTYCHKISILPPETSILPPEGVDFWVMPYGVGRTTLNNITADGLTSYTDWMSGYTMVDAPFGNRPGSRLGFRHGYDGRIPTSEIMYYRWLYKDESETEWNEFTEPVTVHYVKDDHGVVTFPVYSLGPKGINGMNLYEFRPHNAPKVCESTGDCDTYWPTTDWFADIYSGFLESNAISNGKHDIKLEIYNETGNQVMPDGIKSEFIVPTGVDGDGTILTREATSGEIDNGGFVFSLHIDNRKCSAVIDAPSIGTTSMADECGFLRYSPGDEAVHIAFHATHPDNFALFDFRIFRGSKEVTSVKGGEVGAHSVENYTGYGSGNFENETSMGLLLGNCSEAAFSENLHIYAKATTGWGHRINRYDAHAVRAFALSPQ